MTAKRTMMARRQQLTAESRPAWELVLARVFCVIQSMNPCRETGSRMLDCRPPPPPPRRSPEAAEETETDPEPPAYEGPPGDERL